MIDRSQHNEWLFRPAAPWREVTTIERRLFLRMAAAAGGGLLVAAAPIRARERHRTEESSQFLNAFVRITTDDTVVIQAPCPEIGQGVRTSLPMIVAGELGADWERCRFRQAPADDAYGGMTVGGSDSVTDYWEPLRHAAALARQALTAAAAHEWSVAEDQCTVDHGAVRHPASGRSLRFGALADAAARSPAPARVTLRPDGQLDPVGTPRGPVDAEAIVAGQARYGLDVRLPGMLVAVVMRPPVHGARVTNVDDAAARAVPGVVDVIRVPAFAVGGLQYGAVRGGVAVVAEDTWAAIRGRNRLQVTWDRDTLPGGDSADLDRLAVAALGGAPETILRNTGDVDSALAGARRLSADYALPLLAHTCMEPMNFSAHVTDEHVLLTGPTQNPRSLQAVVAAAFRRPMEQVIVQPTLAGGGFGRRLAFDYGVEAAYVARHMRRPVQVVWTREDDVRYDYYRPPSWHRLEAGVAGGRLVAWRHHLATGSLNRQTFATLDSPPSLYDVQGGADMPYDIPNVEFGYSEIDIPVQLGSWRSVSHSFNVFAVESFLDEVATTMVRDPLELRLELLAGGRTTIPLPLPGRRGRPAPDRSRLRGVLEAAATAAGWTRPLEPTWGRGIACCYYKDTYAAHVADVNATGHPRVERVVVALDCGRVVNPDGARAQAEGAIMDAMATMFHWRITLAGGQVEQSNFHDCPALRISDAPHVDVVLLETDRAPSGLGEPPYPSAVPAIANAWFAATGRRERTLPVTRA